MRFNLHASRFPISAKDLSQAMSALVIGISCLTLIGWAFDITWLKSIRPEWNSMRIVTAICLIIGATGLACLGEEQKWKQRLSLAAGIIICGVALLNLFVYGIIIFTHREPSFVALPVFNLFLAASDRMAVITALIFLGFGTAMLLSSDTRHLAGVGHAILLPVTILSYLALVGYIFNVRELNEWLGVRVAFHTGLALCFLCIGLFCARADTWLMGVLTSHESGGVMARRLMPALVVIPLAVGWLRLYGEHSGLFISEVGVALVAVTNTIVLLWLVWFSAKSVNRTDHLRRQVEADLAESEQRVRQKLQAILSPEGSVGDLELADVIDPAVVQTLMDDFYALTHIPMSLINTRGDVLVGVGWQEICTKYHRAHPESCKNCMESDLILSRDVAPGQFKLYKCKNSMWDIATPIVVGGKYMGSVFCGQFFFEGEEIDVEQFRSQARRYGFNEKKYIEALMAVPRLSRKDVDTGMSFLLKLARIFSQLGYSNATLARSLAEREKLMASLSKNQETLRQGEQRLRTILDALPVAVFLSDKDGNVIFTNHAVQLIWGLSEHVSRDTYGMYKGRWLDTHKEIEPDQWALARTLDTGQAYNNDLFEITMDDGERKILFNFALPIRDENGQLTGAVVVTEDVTERVQMEKLFRESQERFRILFQQAAVGIKRLDPQGHLLEVNDKFCEILGYSREELLRLSLSDITHPDDLPMEKADLARLLSREIPSYSLEKRCLRKGGMVIWVRVTSSLPSGGAGPVEWCISVVEDITKRKNAEEAARHATEDLKRSNEDLGQFAYIASHDLQEPLRAVAGFMGILKRRYEDKLDDDAQEFIGHAVEGAERMKALINDLLTFSRVGTKGGAFKPMAMRAALAGALGNLTMAIAESNALITCDDLPTITADATQMMQLLQNLIGNGIKFRGQSRPEIHVSAVREEGRWLFGVRDNGIGIEPRYFDKIFMIFQRLHARTKYSGTGIGLAVCKKIIERHGGVIWVESKAGNGTAFYFTIPDRRDVE